MVHEPNKTAMTIAVVDDEKNIRLTLKTALEREGFTVHVFPNGAEAEKEIVHAKTHFDLCIFDIIMPSMDGLTLLRRLREHAILTPVMFLTSKDEEFDRVLGLELGADDYLCKPFSLRELIARIRVILRRYAANNHAEQEQTPSALNILKSNNGIVLNKIAYNVNLNGTALSLTVTEFRLLEAFLSNKNQVLSREQLIAAAYPDDTYLNDRAIDCHIKRLRKKIGSTCIETVYGLGYKFVE